MADATLWVQQFKAHAVHKLLDEVAELVRRCAELGKDTPETFDPLNQARRVVTHAQLTLKRCDTSITTISSLNNLQSAITACATPLRQYETSRNHEYLNQLSAAGGALESIVAATALFHLRRETSDTKEVRESSIQELGEVANSYIDSLSKKTEDIQNLIETLKQDANVLSERVAGNHTKSRQSLSSLELAIARAEKEQAANATQNELERARVAAHLQTEYKTQMQSDQTEQKNKFDAWLTELNELVSTIKESHRLELRAALAAADAATREKVELIQAELESAQKVVESISVGAMAHGYGQQAQAEAKSAQWWNWGTVLIGVVACGFAAYATLRHPDEARWGFYVLRAATTLGMIALAAFTGKRAGTHMAESRHLRRRQLEIAAIDPYLALLPVEEKNAVKKLVAERIFGQPENPPEKDVTAGELGKLGLEVAKAVLDKAPAAKVP